MWELNDENRGHGCFYLFAVDVDGFPHVALYSLLLRHRVAHHRLLGSAQGRAEKKMAGFPHTGLACDSWLCSVRFA